MIKRKAGWYWVRLKQEWRTARWDGVHWTEPNYAFGDTDDVGWNEVGPRIPTPEEPWQCVPKHEPTEAMIFKAECEAKSKEVDINSPHPTEHPDEGGGAVGAYYRGLLSAAPKP